MKRKPVAVIEMEEFVTEVKRMKNAEKKDLIKKYEEFVCILFGKDDLIRWCPSIGSYHRWKAIAKRLK